MCNIDAGFPSGALLAGLEERGVHHVARLRANPALDRLAAPHMNRPSGWRPTEPRMWTHELEHQASTWDEPRRVVLVVKERPDDLLLDRFFLVTSISRFQMNGQALLEYYRQRGKSEGHMGELMDVLAPALSSTNRPKTHLRGKTPKTTAPAVDAFACNEVRLLIAMLAYQTMHIARRAMVRATGSAWSAMPKTPTGDRLNLKRVNPAAAAVISDHIHCFHAEQLFLGLAGSNAGMALIVPLMVALPGNAPFPGLG